MAIPHTMAFAPMAAFGQQGNLTGRRRRGPTLSNWDGVEQLKSLLANGEVESCRDADVCRRKSVQQGLTCGSSPRWCGVCSTSPDRLTQNRATGSRCGANESVLFARQLARSDLLLPVERKRPEQGQRHRLRARSRRHASGQDARSRARLTGRFCRARDDGGSEESQGQRA